MVILHVTFGGINGEGHQQRKAAESLSKAECTRSWGIALRARRGHGALTIVVLEGLWGSRVCPLSLVNMHPDHYAKEKGLT